MIQRPLDIGYLKKLLDLFPVTAILGPRQCGKTTLSQLLEADHLFDLENPADMAKLDNPKLLLEPLEGLIIIDEVQRMPDLFPLLRYLVDKYPKQKYLILGSASRRLLRQSSESLAGRIGYLELGGFRVTDLPPDRWRALWIRGGFPRSYLAETESDSLVWRRNFISTFLERDIPQLGISIPSHTLRRFWVMIAHYHGQILNYSELSRSFGISDMTARKYIEILQGTFMLRVLQPWYENISKRLVKSPKIYLRDSGLLHALLGFQDEQQILGHPKLGASWEGFALEATCRMLNKSNEEFFFWRTHSGAELDLYWQEGGRAFGIEFKYTDAPSMTRSMVSVITDLRLAHLWVVYPGSDSYRLHEKITVLPLNKFAAEYREEAGSAPEL